MLTRVRLPLCIVAAVGIALTAAHARQSGFPPTSLTNVQVLPKNAPPDAVIGLMKEFTRSLGVRCDHCHVGQDGQPLSTFNFASDDKPTKATARTMMRMVEQINASLDQAVPSETRGRVTCWTCHSGRRTPRRQ